MSKHILGVNVDASGCEIITDSDSDGIEDSEDECSNTPPGESVDAMVAHNPS